MTTKASWPIKIKAVTKNPKPKPKKRVKRRGATPRRRKKKTTVQFPPPFRLSQKLLKKLVEKYQVHENPDPPDCETCGMKYRDLKTGLDFQSVMDMLWVAKEDPDTWRQKGRSSVLGLWFEIKRAMWDDHKVMCQKPDEQAAWLEDFDDSDFAY